MADEDQLDQLSEDADALLPGAQFEPEFSKLWTGSMPEEEALPPGIAALELLGAVTLIVALVLHAFLITYAAVAGFAALLLGQPDLILGSFLGGGHDHWQRVRSRLRAGKLKRFRARRVALGRFIELVLISCTLSIGAGCVASLIGGCLRVFGGASQVLDLGLSLIGLGVLVPIPTLVTAMIVTVASPEAVERNVRVLTADEVADRLTSWRGRRTVVVILALTAAAAPIVTAL